MPTRKPVSALVLGVAATCVSASALAQAPAPLTSTPAPPPAAAAGSGMGKVRVRATCGTDPRPMAESHALAVDELTSNDHARPLKPSSDPSPRMKVDEDSHKEILTDPDFVDFDLPPGPHRLRIAASRCQPEEEAVDVGAGETVEIAPHLEATATPVRFRRPGDAPAGEHISLLDHNGRVLCADLPCNWDVPMRSGYVVSWARPLGTMTAEVPETLDTLGLPAGKSTKIDERMAHQASVWAWPLVAAGGATTLAGIILYASKLGQSCTQVFYGAGGKDIAGDFRCGTHTNGSGEAALSETQTTGAVGETALGMMIGGGVLVAAGVVLVAGVLGHDALTLRVETSRATQKPPAVQAVATPWGLSGSF